MKTTSTLGVALTLTAISLSGCGGDAPPADVTPQLVRAQQACPNPEGGSCLGSLRPGTYTTQAFAPAITYTVPRGWTNREDLPGNFQLQREGDNRSLGIYRDANAPLDCQEAFDPAVGQSVKEYTGWLRRHPLLRVTRPVAVSIGGLRGVYVDVSKAPGNRGKGCPFSDLGGDVPIIIGGRGPAGLHHVITDTPGFEERLYVLRYRRGNVVIEVGPEGASLGAYLQQVVPILRTLKFGRG
jgi:hypothetical protein